MSSRRNITAATLLKKNYPTYGFEGAYRESFGDVEKFFRMIIYGESGSGKTRFCAKLAKYLTQWGKVYFNSLEQGEGKGLQDVFAWADLSNREAGRISIGDCDHFEEMCERLDRDKQIRFIFIDSLDYMNLTKGQYKHLIEKYPNKCFIIICWSKNGKPESQHGKGIEYMVDIKCEVKRGYVHAKSRYTVGKPKPFQIFEPVSRTPLKLPSEDRDVK